MLHLVMDTLNIDYLRVAIILQDRIVDGKPQPPPPETSRAENLSQVPRKNRCKLKQAAVSTFGRTEISVYETRV